MGQYRYHMTIPGDMLFFLSVFPAENLRSATWDPKFQAVEVRSRDAPPCCHLPWNIFSPADLRIAQAKSKPGMLAMLRIEGIMNA